MTHNGDVARGIYGPGAEVEIRGPHTHGARRWQNTGFQTRDGCDVECEDKTKNNPRKHIVHYTVYALYDDDNNNNEKNNALFHNGHTPTAFNIMYLYIIIM